MALSHWLRHLGIARSSATSTPRQVLNARTRTVVASRVEVADRGPVRRRGLLGRQSLSPGEGLWIVPCEAVHTVGMRFPIDLIFLDRRNVVRKTRSNVPPWRLSGCIRAHSVIELPAGTLAATSVSPGDTLHFSSSGQAAPGCPRCAD